MKIIFTNRIYQFGGVKYKHVAGGPIGLCLMSLMVIVVMDTWALAFLSKLDTASAKIWALMKYVDDVNMMIDMLDLGVEWVEEKLEKVEPSSKPVGVISRERHTMSVIKQAVDSILHWLSFMADLPEDHASGMVPMLDLQVWVHHAQHQHQVTCPATEVFRREGLVYQIDCTTCLQQQQQSSYTGESSRSAFQRKKDHNTALENEDTSSPLVVHAVAVHSGEKPNFIMRITSIEGNALKRQVTETVHIACKPNNTENMNRQNLWGMLPRLRKAGAWGLKQQKHNNNKIDSRSRETITT